MSLIWPGEMFGFRSNGRVATARQRTDAPEEQTILLGDLVRLGGALYTVTSVEPKSSPDVQMNDVIELIAERIPG